MLEAYRYGDRTLFAAHPELDRAPIRVHFRSSRRRYRRRERWGTPADYRLEDS
ncbi:MAG: staygreen family protein [Anaerolineae bacterium]